jgi:anaphase-promoting complex subunit 1
MTLGLMFIGRGRYALSTNNLSIAALIIAFYPVFPQHVADNRYVFLSNSS